MSLLIGAGANINVQDIHGYTALMWGMEYIYYTFLFYLKIIRTIFNWFEATQNGYFDSVNKLIKSGANLNMQDDMGHTSLILCKIWQN